MYDANRSGWVRSIGLTPYYMVDYVDCFTGFELGLTRKRFDDKRIQK
jgi:hypothetical protein